MNDKNKNTFTYQTIIIICSYQIFISQITQLKMHEKSKNVLNVNNKKNTKHCTTKQLKKKKKKKNKKKNYHTRKHMIL